MKKIPKSTINEKESSKLVSLFNILEFLKDDNITKKNLATFCQTSMDNEAIKLISSTLGINAIDKTEYPKTTEIENRILKIIEKLWHGKNTLGLSTIGSSEAAMLAGISLKKRWEKTNKRSKKVKPNLIISSGYQLCWEKFSKYFDVDLIEIPITKECPTLNIKKAINSINKGTIGIVAILGHTYTGKFDDVKGLDNSLTKYNKKNNKEVRIHVDAASGGFFTPFVNKDLVWDFKLKNVSSINASGHKYGLVYPGIGFMLLKNKTYLQNELKFNVTYLGGKLSTFSFNFSKSAAHLIAQYYIFTSLGMSGFKKVHLKTLNYAKKVYTFLKTLDLFDFINIPSKDNLPVICYSLNKKKKWNLYHLSDELEKFNFQVPTYYLPKNLKNIVVQRIVIRADFNLILYKELMSSFTKSIRTLENKQKHPNKYQKIKGFTH